MICYDKKFPGFRKTKAPQRSKRTQGWLNCLVNGRQETDRCVSSQEIYSAASAFLSASFLSTSILFVFVFGWYSGVLLVNATCNYLKSCEIVSIVYFTKTFQPKMFSSTSQTIYTLKYLISVSKTKGEQKIMNNYPTKWKNRKFILFTMFSLNWFSRFIFNQNFPTKTTSNVLLRFA